MPILTPFDQVLTPHGYRYPYQLPPGSAVWTWADGVFETFRWRYKTLDLLPRLNEWADVQIDQRWKKRWWSPDDEDYVVVPSGVTGCWARIHQDSRVGSVENTVRVIVPERELVSIPYTDLVTDPKPQGRRAYTTPDRASRLLDANRTDTSRHRADPLESATLTNKWWSPDERPLGPPLIKHIRPAESLRRIGRPSEVTLIKVKRPVIHNGLIIH